MDEIEGFDEASKMINPEEVQKAFDFAEERAAEVQEQHLQAAQSAGYTRDVIRETAPFYVQLAQLSEDMPELRGIVNSGVDFAYSISTELGQVSEETQPITRHLFSVSSSAATFVATSGSAASILDPENEKLINYEAPPSFLADQTPIEKKLSLIDPTLANIYREIGQALYGTTADPERAAIGLMRQVFDHFFGILAPDEKVRQSPYWKPKKGEKTDQVTRRERMTYAAYTHITDKARAETIIANFTHILETYQFLNKLHQRDALSPKQARIALKTMQKFIQTWVDAMDL